MTGPTDRNIDALLAAVAIQLAGAQSSLDQAQHLLAIVAAQARPAAGQAPPDGPCSHPVELRRPCPSMGRPRQFQCLQCNEVINPDADPAPAPPQGGPA